MSTRPRIHVDRHATIDPAAWQKLVALLRDLIAAPTPDQPRKP